MMTKHYVTEEGILRKILSAVGKTLAAVEFSTEFQLTGLLLTRETPKNDHSCMLDHKNNHN